ncbi:hypothetical protein [endosymbiont GvMRE of Glomus versiforme]|uniref:hypothetical protein n=1 Tax=endosymbiont GvMRE of Glomus versiforme TaxID=2039283 RepID=UPI0011C418DF|nr:hypothetical protein [endosymbiont GvMRE of Glomus versiforme]
MSQESKKIRQKQRRLVKKFKKSQYNQQNNLIEDKFIQSNQKIIELETEITNLKKILGLVSEIVKEQVGKISDLTQKTELLSEKLLTWKEKENSKQILNLDNKEKFTTLNQKFEEIIKKGGEKSVLNLKRVLEKEEQRSREEKNTLDQISEPKDYLNEGQELNKPQNDNREKTKAIQCFKCKFFRPKLSDIDYPMLSEIRQQSDSYWWNNQWTENQDYCEPCYYGKIKELKT